MPENKVKYANFPERELKVVIGPHINAAMTKTLSRLTIGTYEMSFTQQERCAGTGEAARLALTHVAKTLNLTVKSSSHRDFVAVHSAEGAEHTLNIWVTTPFELTQTGHVVWIKYCSLGEEAKTGVAFKLATSYNINDIENMIQAAMKNAEKLEPGAPYTLKGNPPPRFAKKVKAEEAKTEEAPAAASEEKAPASEG
jgi:hypothetical protein